MWRNLQCNEANLLNGLNAWLELDSEPGTLLEPRTASEHFVTNIDYNAKGQRKIIKYGNRVQTTYNYDNDSFRLTQMQTVREDDGWYKIAEYILLLWSGW